MIDRLTQGHAEPGRIVDAVAAAVLGRAPPVDLAPFHAGRLAGGGR